MSEQNIIEVFYKMDPALITLNPKPVTALLWDDHNTCASFNPEYSQ